MALDQRAGRLYVACPDEDEILAIDVASAEIVERTRLFPGDGPREIALTPDGRTLVSVNPGSNSVSFFDASPLTRLDRVGVESGPGALAIDPAGQRAFVFNALSGSVSVVDLAQRRVVTTISMDSAPLRGQFSARGDRLFVIHERSPYLTVVDPVSLAVVRRERLRTSGSAIKVDARRGWISIGSPGSRGRLLRTQHAAARRCDDGQGWGGPHDHRCRGQQRVPGQPGDREPLVGSVADRRVATEIDVGKGPSWVAVMGEK
jgi:YVTN family beta-propeller protein